MQIQKFFLNHSKKAGPSITIYKEVVVYNWFLIEKYTNLQAKGPQGNCSNVFGEKETKTVRLLRNKISICWLLYNEKMNFVEE